MKKILLSLLAGSLLVAFAFAGSQEFTPADKVSIPSSAKVNGTPVSQGGDTIGDAALVFTIPFYACGTTVGYNNDYDEICPYDGSTAPDVVYTYAPSADILVDVTLCDDSVDCLTDFDTKLYIYDANMALIDCNDDACASIGYPYSYVSALYGVQLFAGNVYYIIIDGYGDDAGSYALNIYEATPPPPGPECPDDTIFGQNPTGPDGNWSFATSDATLGYKVADNFWDVFLPICDIHWWGLSLIYDGGWSLCEEDPMPFLIEFWYNLDEGPVCSYQAMVNPVDSGILYAGFYPMWYFSVDMLDPCCYLENGYVSIQSLGTCSFLWASSDFGDGNSWQSTDGVWDYVGTGFDRGFCLTFGDEPTEIKIPQSLQLNQNYPNPFNPTTQIDYSLTQPEQVNLSVYNLTGELVATLVDGEVPVGNHSITFDASTLPSGVYFYTMTAGSFTQTKKMVVVK